MGRGFAIVVLCVFMASACVDVPATTEVSKANGLNVLSVCLCFGLGFLGWTHGVPLPEPAVRAGSRQCLWPRDSARTDGRPFTSVVPVVFVPPSLVGAPPQMHLWRIPEGETGGSQLLGDFASSVRSAITEADTQRQASLQQEAEPWEAALMLAHLSLIVRLDDAGLSALKEELGTWPRSSGALRSTLELFEDYYGKLNEAYDEDSLKGLKELRDYAEVFYRELAAHLSVSRASALTAAIVALEPFISFDEKLAALPRDVLPVEIPLIQSTIGPLDGSREPEYGELFLFNVGLLAPGAEIVLSPAEATPESIGSLELRGAAQASDGSFLPQQSSRLYARQFPDGTFEGRARPDFFVVAVNRLRSAGPYAFELRYYPVPTSTDYKVLPLKLSDRSKVERIPAAYPGCMPPAPGG